MKITDKNAVGLSETKQLDQFISRRRAMIMALGGTALAGLAFTGSAQAQTTAPTDTDILNFALNLEYLEAEYYTLATSGKTIDDAEFGVGITGTGVQGTVTVKANPKITFMDPTIGSYALETAAEERKHVTLLRNALGTAAVAQPALNLNTSFSTLAAAAGITGPAFDPFANDLSFLLGSYIFEDVGVTAYHGAAALITTPANLVAAAGLLGAEAYHAGLIRTVLYAMAQTTPAIFVDTIAISKLRATLDGTGNDDVGLGTPVTAPDIGGAAATVVNADVNAIAFARTTTQVLHIVYGAGPGAVTSGGFFPAGLNGTITSTTA